MKIYRRDVLGSYLVAFTHPLSLVILVVTLIFTAQGVSGYTIGGWMLVGLIAGAVAFAIVSERMELGDTTLTLRTKFGLNRVELLLRHIEGVEKRQSILSWLVGVGWIRATTGEGATFSFGPIRNPDAVLKEIREAIGKSTPH